MWRGKTAGMLAAFQGFSTPHGGKKQGKMYKLFIDSSLGVSLRNSEFRIPNLIYKPPRRGTHKTREECINYG